ncbi:circadian clock-controlled protein daywake-like [Vanessa tameamea]|uniref:Circadian clock-controlled protein daywake-like n=1 Tax=Vanessa tameamea TaxID=334116 RepID=A0A8B8ISH6_VANTA|nr:circadian clock-controlled protein-like [Vanessa tameamea]
MGFLIYFAIIGIQFTSTLVSGSIPLKCFLQNHSFPNVFGRNTNVTSPNFRFNTLKEEAITLDKDGWLFDTTNLEYQGLDDAILEDFGFNFNSNVSQISFRTDMVVTHPYKTGGSLFAIPISGEGSCNINVKNVQFGLIMPFDIKEENGKKFIELKRFDYWYDVRDNVEFNFSNLYNGNKELSDSMHFLINQNWKFMTTQFGKIFMDPVADRFYNTFKDYMLSMPLRDFNSC